MRPEQLTEHYPRLFHMAWPGSWTSVRRNGLLSTQSLVELSKLGPEESCAILRQHRPESIEISCYGLCTATIRDQKPMDDKGVCRALRVDDPAPWYELLNSMVFFWPTIKRLRKMMGAKAYKGMRHDLLVVDTEKLVDRHHDKIRLSRMNSGATKPYPHPRCMGLFKTFEEFPFDERLKQRGRAMAIAEVCVVGSIPDIADVVVDVHAVTLDNLGDLI
ncbi:MAG: hypothetical protein OXC91_11495 [Rhodobacteraceae bacterium]|nr:hypothetical protein [Paracoccaceae bacterium]